MLISHRKHFIYTKTVKTAGTSVEVYFERFCLPEGYQQLQHARDEYVGPEGVVGYRGSNVAGHKWRNHMPAREIRQAVGDQVWRSYFKFCVIRNPFDKLVSAFYFLEDRQRNSQTKTLTWKDQLKRLYKNPDPIACITGTDPVERFRSWIRAGGSIIDRNKYTIDGQICVDYFIRFEDLAAGVKHVCSELDIPFEPRKIPRLKTGIRRTEIPLRDYYDAATIAIVKRIYKFELETFGYSEP
ncbi:MAG TPA: sulfotransferase family 2 domain-containing protein [Candidatus Eisenbacteria bacterium]|nr:sulfotransferase family 2 domain-containing protein [Candidatus Eisenbacteria bacterium]